MARRKKTRPADALLELVAMLPWWAGAALALLSYLLLHGVASRPVTAATQAGQLDAMVIQTLWKTLASFGQYLLPLICLGGAAMSAWQRRKREALGRRYCTKQGQRRARWHELARIRVAGGRRLSAAGYQVIEVGGGGADGGVDLVLTKSGKNGREKFFVQCKQWRAFTVGVDVVRELYGVMAARGATGGFVVTSGRFTDEAVSFVSGRNLTLVDGPKLHGLLRQAQAGTDRSSTRPAAATAAPSRAAPIQVPSCPVCTTPMARRTAKRGTNAGAEFWGCTGYPACRGTRPIG